MAIVPESTGKKPEIEDGNYTFQITEVKQDVWQSDEYGHAGEANLTIRCLIMGVLDEDGEDVYLDPRVNLKYKRPGKTQASSLYLYAKAAGVCPPEGTPFDTDLLEGRVLQGNITTEEGKWPRIEPKSLMPVKAVRGQAVPMSQKAQEAPSEARAPWEGDVVDADTVSAWWQDILGQGFQRPMVLDLCAEMFERRTPGMLNAAELKGLNDQLLATA